MITRTRLLIIIAVLAFVVVNVLTLRDGHNWGDDFAQYILHAVNLIEHRPYTADIVMDLWTVVPPGFPLLLSALIYWFGINLPALKFLNVIGWGLSAILVHYLARRRLGGAWPFMLTVWFLSSPFFFIFKQDILSDVPFLCFISLGIWAFLKQEEGGAGQRLMYLLSVFFMSYAVLIRWAGLSFLLAAVIYYFYVRKEPKKIAGFAVGALAAALINLSFAATNQGHFGAAQFSGSQWLYSVWMNAAYLPIGFMDFAVGQAGVSKEIWHGAFGIFKILGPVMIWGASVLFGFCLLKRKVGFLGLFVGIYGLGLLVWPVQQGVVRYSFPVLVPLVIYAAVFLRAFFPSRRGEAILLGMTTILIALNVYSIIRQFNYEENHLHERDTLEMAVWVSEHLAPEEHYMFKRPRALRLLTDRTGTAFWVYPEDRDHWYRRIAPLGIDYLIADKELDAIAGHDAITLPGEIGIIPVWQNGRYKIFKVKRP